MTIRIQCFKCREEYELDDSMGGKFLECKCGEGLAIPASEESGEEKECPSCGSAVKLDSILCIECGYNFKTGGQVEAGSGDDEEDYDEEEEVPVSTWYKIAPFVKPAIIITVVAIVGLVIYYNFLVKPYGISSSTPLGTLDKLQEAIDFMKLKKADKVVETPAEFGCKAKIYTYTDEDMIKKTKGASNETLYIVVGPNDEICAVGGSFTTVAMTSSRLNYFFNNLWNASGFKKPLFETQGKRFGLKDVAKAENDSVKAEWINYTPKLPAASYSIIFILKKYKEDKMRTGYYSPDEE